MFDKYALCAIDRTMQVEFSIFKQKKSLKI